MSRVFSHQPVMLDEVVRLFGTVPAGVIVDATIGGGGHAAVILEARPDLMLVGIDRDADAVAAATATLDRFGRRAVVRRGRFDGARAMVDGLRASGEIEAEAPVTGVLFDLGVSSAQLDRPERGFSYRFEGPLDMRMDPGSGGPTAADLVNTMDEGDLARLFEANGEGRLARRIARTIVAARPVGTTTALAEAVAAAVPAAARRRGHPAKRVFQALRIAVNDEQQVLGPAVDDALEMLAPGGRCVVLSYHSGEDRAVKAHFVAAATGGCTCPPGLPCVCGARPTVRLLTRGAGLPSKAEKESNPRAESARLRAVERLADEPEEA